MTNLLHGAHVANKLFSTIARLRLLLVMFLTLTVSAEVLGADNLFNVTSYNSIPSGWTNSSVTTGSYFNFNTNNCSLTSPLYDPHTDLILTYKVATYGSGTNHPLTIQLLDENGNVKQTHTTGTPTSSTYISGTWSIGTVNYKFKIKFYLATAGKGVRLQVPKLVGNPATSTEPYTVTLDAGPGTCAASVTEASAGAGVTLLTPTLECGDWEFAGWTTSAVATETSSKPATLLTGTYKPTSNITLYAVYKRTKEGEGGGSTPTEESKTYTFSEYEVGTQYAEETYELDDDVTINIKGCHINTQLRVYGGQDGTVISSKKLPGRIVSMGFNMGYKADELVVSGSTDGSSWTEVGSISTTTSYKDYTLDFGETNYTYFKLNVEGSSQIRIAKMSITYESTSGGGSSSTTYYHSTPECTTETTVCVIPKCGGDGGGTWLVVIE